jgi:hypothetical protein
MPGTEVEGTPSIAALRASYAAAFCERCSKTSFCPAFGRSDRTVVGPIREESDQEKTRNTLVNVARRLMVNFGSPLTVLEQYHLSPELKFANGGHLDRGRTARWHVVATGFVWIGKEANQVRGIEEDYPIITATAQFNSGLGMQER